MPQRSTPLLALVVLVLAACDGSDLVGVRSEDVRIDRADAGLLVHNGGDDPIYYFAIDQEEGALVDWGPCSDPETCVGVEPGESHFIPAAEIMGWRPEGEVLFYWWRLLVTVEGEYEPDNIRSVVIGPLE